VEADMSDHEVTVEQVERTADALARPEQLARDGVKASTQQLFAEYQEHRDPAVRETLLRRFLPLARRVAFGYASSSEPLDDLLQVATLALLVAIDRFDPDRGFGFPAFAIPTMTGALKRHFRGATWGVHVARGAQERALAIDDATEFLATLNGRAPTLQEIARYLSISVEEVLEGHQVKVAYRSESLDAPAKTRDGYRESITVGDSIGAEDYGYELVEHKVEIARALNSLSDLEREVLRLRFVGDMTQLQIAKEVGISQMQVSRVLRRSLDRMRSAADTTATPTDGAPLEQSVE
jgi:RNA polymerase sigma-B factor